MNLKIENNQLLKPYLAPYSRKDGGSHRKRTGWTPDRGPEVQAIFEKLRTDRPDAPDFFLWQLAEQERGAELIKRRRPYPGWFPVLPVQDKKIGKAYRELYARMGEYPPDGDYVFEGGVMRATE